MLIILMRRLSIKINTAPFMGLLNGMIYMLFIVMMPVKQIKNKPPFHDLK